MDTTAVAAGMKLPSLPLEAWEQSKMTLHLYLQIVGKIQLALMPRKNHWWNITFLVNSRGLTTHVIPFDGGSFEIQFNFLLHRVEISTSAGDAQSIPLEDGLSVAVFHDQLFRLLEDMGIQVKIRDRPYSLPDDNPIMTPFAEMTGYHHYDPEHVQRFWRILVWVDRVFNTFSGRFYGKTCPVQLYWHHMDLAVTRFCGRRGPAMPAEASTSNKEAYSHEVISAGFWAGDDKVRGAAFYSYTYPSPDGLEREPLEPVAAHWVPSNGSPMAILMYEDLRQSEDPDATLLDFLESSYRAGAKLSRWDVADLQVPPLSEV